MVISESFPHSIIYPFLVFSVESWICNVMHELCDPVVFDHRLVTLGYLIAIFKFGSPWCLSKPSSKWLLLRDVFFYWVLLVNHNNCYASWCVHHLTYTWRMLMSTWKVCWMHRDAHHNYQPQIWLWDNSAIDNHIIYQLKAWCPRSSSLKVILRLCKKGVKPL